MEGTNGIIREMGTKPAQPQQISVGAEAGSEIVSPVVNISKKDENTTAGQEVKDPVKSEQIIKEATPEAVAKNNDQSQQQEQQQPEDTLTEEEIAKDFDKLWNNLDDKTKKRFAKYLKDDKEKKFIETSVEFLRALKLIFALLSLMISPFKEPKEFYTGEDLTLSDSPPEGRTHQHPIKNPDRNPEESWKNFRKEVDNMKKPMTFGEFMNAVLTANATHSKDITIIKPEKGEKSEKKLELLKMLITRNLGKETSHSLRRALSQPRSKPAPVRRAA